MIFGTPSDPSSSGSIFHPTFFPSRSHVQYQVHAPSQAIKPWRRIQAGAGARSSSVRILSTSQSPSQLSRAGGPKLIQIIHNKIFIKMESTGRTEVWLSRVLVNVTKGLFITGFTALALHVCMPVVFFLAKLMYQHVPIVY